MSTEKTVEKMFEICSKLIIKTSERRHWRRSGVFIVNFEHISHFLVFVFFTLNMQMFPRLPFFSAISAKEGHQAL